jgi:hypothetical protein
MNLQRFNKTETCVLQSVAIAIQKSERHDISHFVDFGRHMTCATFGAGDRVDA